MSGTIGGVAVTVGANVSQFISEMARASAATTGLDGSLKGAIGTLAKYAAAAVSAHAAYELWNKSSENIDAQAKLARAVGGTTAGFQAAAYAADLAGVSQNALASASGKLNVKLGEAIQKGGESALAFERLGLNVQDLANMDADQRLAAIADRIKSLGMDSTTAGFALKEMGLKGEEMRQFLMDGGEQIRQARQDTIDFGVALSNVDSNKVEAANDAMSRIGLVAEGVGNQIAVGLAPYIQIVSERIADAAKGSHGFRDQIQSAIKTGVEWAAVFADGMRYVHLVIKGVEVAVGGVVAALIVLFDELATAIVSIADVIDTALNSAIDASNSLLGTQYELISLPSKSPFMEGLHLATSVATDRVKELHGELIALKNEEMPSDGVKKFLTDVANVSTSDAKEADSGRNNTGTNTSDGPTKEDKKAAADAAKHDSTVNNIMQGLSAGTEAMQAELTKREQILAIYKQNTLSTDAPYYTKQLNDIKINEALKQAEIDAAYAKDLASREQKKAENLARVGTDKAAIAAIIAEYDQQEVLAEQIKQQQLTGVQEEAQGAREKLREIEKQRAISTALGLGQQLMGVAQGHSKKTFEFAKNAALVSATIDGYKSATAAWNSGMSIGGPWAPLFAASFTAASLLRTGALIQGIRSTSYNSGGGGAGAAGGGGSPAPAPAAAPTGGGGGPAPGPQSGNTMHASFVGDFFNGSAVERIAKGLVQYQKDGGTVVIS